MSISDLNDELLHEKTLEASRHERRATLELLEFLAEVDERRLYNARGFSSLWEYAHKALGYSEAQASERVSAMRLMRKVPEVREKVAANLLTLTATAKLAVFVRREKCTPAEATAMLERVAEKPTREVERILAAAQAVPERRMDSVRPAGPETTRVAFDADPEFLVLLEQAKNLQGRPEWSLNDRMKAALKEYVASRAPKISRLKTSDSETQKSGTPSKSDLGVTLKSTSRKSSKDSSLRAPEVKSTRYVPVAVRNQIRIRSGDRCEFIDPKSSRRCESRFDLEFDHIRPFALGGKTTEENLRHLCASHNHWEAIRVFGKDEMRSFWL